MMADSWSLGKVVLQFSITLNEAHIIFTLQILTLTQYCRECWQAEAWSKWMQKCKWAPTVTHYSVYTSAAYFCNYWDMQII